MKNTSELKLLAGPMTVIADDTHVARTSIDVSLFIFIHLLLGLTS